ncbi:MAG: alpha/beta hydrolase [Rhodococcus fascians]
MSELLPNHVDVSGARIRWGRRGGPGHDLILLHGNGANHTWWNSVARYLEHDWSLILLDLSGHGDSDHRLEYHPTHWVDEVRAVARAADAHNPVVVGHSMGGRVALTLGANYPDGLSGLVVMDSSVRSPDRYRPPPSVNRVRKYYESREAALSRFRLLPVQPHPSATLIDELAAHAISETPQGWTWKYDPHSLWRFDDADIDRAAKSLAIPLGYVYGRHSSVVDAEIVEYIRSAAGACVETVAVEDAYHHLILDQPEQCAHLIDRFAHSFTGASTSDAPAEAI